MRTVRRCGPAGPDLLEDRECLRLLRTVPVGRVVFTRGGLPAVRVVGFRVDEDTIVFVADDEEGILAALRGDVVAFEADYLDADQHVGWTVTAVGHLSVVPPDEALVLAPAEPGRQLIRLGVESLRGHRLLV
ncbi:pyridoxamine 5'-phosphate oxidase family protein [Kribbella capetownensis]|uniref:Pyridoxamine 5'-phosphate oxidase family protein n=1 Tax=Kribbella capetownensis TaxID=1572659 RepID=A0A4R0JNR9_9ACTN|nr:pyridoxamine 5'-phosphate oxidase family protein [Kribbella capetownensis]TCC47554.1 pyridoxamine 5'-phosphate oxidase family protein [Kribbella capetownensis]